MLESVQPTACSTISTIRSCYWLRCLCLSSLAANAPASCSSAAMHQCCAASVVAASPPKSQPCTRILLLNKACNIRALQAHPNQIQHAQLAYSIQSNIHCTVQVWPQAHTAPCQSRSRSGGRQPCARAWQLGPSTPWDPDPRPEPQPCFPPACCPPAWHPEPACRA